MSGNIKVAIRTRPFVDSQNEKWAPGFEIKGSRIVFGMKIFDPDIVFDQDVTQDRVFDQCMPIIESVKDGHNGTIMVYGQTGTGKTHTMLGGEADNSGVTFRAIEHLLHYVSDRTVSGASIALTLSMIEIYNERMSDMLLQPNSSSDNNGPEITLINGVPMGTTKITLETTDAAVATVRRALTQRHVSPTAMNERSSRSHVIVMLDLEEKIGERYDIRHLYLVDLAGSESVKKSQAVGKAAAEAGMINKSLLALRSVVTALTTASNGGRVHVPYRDSKLTELLKDSIGGTARTMLIACISPVGRDIEETKNTLEYATKARKIRNNPNEMEKLQSRIRNLEFQLQAQINKNGGMVVISKDDATFYSTLEEQNAELTAKVDQLGRHVEESQAAQHIQTSVVNHLRLCITDAVQEVAQKNAQVEELKQVYYDAMLRLEQATAEVYRKQEARWGTVESLVEEEFARNATNIQLWGQQTLNESALKAKHKELIQKYHGQVRKDVQSHTADLIAKMQPFAVAVKSNEATRLDEIEEQVAQWRSLQAQQEALMSKLLRTAATRAQEAGDLAEEHTERLCSHAQGAPEPSDLPFAHFVDDIVSDIGNSLQTQLPSPTPSPQLQETIQQLRNETRLSSRSSLAESLPPLSSFAGPTSPHLRPTTFGLQAVKDVNNNALQRTSSSSTLKKRPRLEEGLGIDRPSKRPGFLSSPFAPPATTK